MQWLSDQAIPAYRITLECTDGVVSLHGTVNNILAKERALEITETVKGVSGIRSVENNITLSYPAQRSDRQILVEIEQGLLWDALVDHQLVEAMVKNGKVALTGTIGSAAEKTRAISGSWVAGVTDVDAADLTVARWARDTDLRTEKHVPKSDEAIKNAVMLSIAKDPHTSAGATVDVMVQAGTVTLKGSVDYLQARRAAAQDARKWSPYHYSP